MKTANKNSTDRAQSGIRRTMIRQVRGGTRRTISFITSSKESGESTGSISQRPIAIGRAFPKISRVFWPGVRVNAPIATGHDPYYSHCYVDYQPSRNIT